MNRYSANGFALLSAVWILAILSLVTITVSTTVRQSTDSVHNDIQDVQTELLFSAGLNFAVLSLVSPRTTAAANGVPMANLMYRAPNASVLIDIKNESGFIDLITADTELLNELLRSAQIEESVAKDLIQRLRAMDSQPNFRSVRTILNEFPGLYQRVMNVSSVYNRQSGINPHAASPAVLSRVPELSSAEREKWSEVTNRAEQTLISTPSTSRHFTNAVSPFYRITLSTDMGGIRRVRTTIIKIENQSDRRYRLIATL